MYWVPCHPIANCIKPLIVSEFLSFWPLLVVHDNASGCVRQKYYVMICLPKKNDDLENSESTIRNTIGKTVGKTIRKRYTGPVANTCIELNHEFHFSFLIIMFIKKMDLVCAASWLSFLHQDLPTHLPKPDHRQTH